jgi:hypothetical protein
MATTTRKDRYTQIKQDAINAAGGPKAWGLLGMEPRRALIGMQILHVLYVQDEDAVTDQRVRAMLFELYGQLIDEDGEL